MDCLYDLKPIWPPTFFSNFKPWKSLDHGMLSRDHVWEGLFGEAVQSFLFSPCSFTELCFHKANRGLSLFSLQWHLPTWSQGQHRVGVPASPQGSPSALWGVASGICIRSFRAYQHFLCNRLLLEKAAENNSVALCAWHMWSKNMRVHVWPNATL